MGASPIRLAGQLDRPAGPTDGAPLANRQPPQEPVPDEVLLGNGKRGRDTEGYRDYRLFRWFVEQELLPSGKHDEVRAGHVGGRWAGGWVGRGWGGRRRGNARTVGSR